MDQDEPHPGHVTDQHPGRTERQPQVDGDLRTGPGFHAQAADLTVLRPHPRIRVLLPLTGGDKRFDCQVVVRPGPATRLEVRADERALLRRGRLATRVAVAEQVGTAAPPAGVVEPSRPAVLDSRDFLAVPHTLRGYARVAVQRRSGSAEKLRAEAVDVDPVGRVLAVMPG